VTQQFDPIRWKLFVTAHEPVPSIYKEYISGSLEYALEVHSRGLGKVVARSSNAICFERGRIDWKPCTGEEN
jgi:hypothetical protein